MEADTRSRGTGIPQQWGHLYAQANVLEYFFAPRRRRSKNNALIGKSVHVFEDHGY